MFISMRRIALGSTGAAVFASLLTCHQVLGWRLPFSFTNPQSPLLSQDQGSGPQIADDHRHTSSMRQDWDLFEHLGGNGPWIPKVRGVVDTNIDVPPACYVDQVHMLSRHAERFPTKASGNDMIELIQRLYDANITFKGDLKFLQDWDFFSNNPAEHFESLVSTGPFAGTLEAFTTGVKLRSRYLDLLDHAIKHRATKFWASDSHRVIDSARYFAAGLFGIDWERLSKLVVISERPELGADTLTPGHTCLKYRSGDDHFGHDYGYKMRNSFIEAYAPFVLARLAHENPGLPLTNKDVFNMQTMCGFETIARGSSPWCDLFTRDELESFAYARDLLHYYRAGPGNRYGPTMGWLWLNATAKLLEVGSAAGPLFFSFTHDGDIIPMLAALDLFPQSSHLPVSHVLHNHTYTTSDIVPMGGRVILERMTCRVRENCWSNPLYPNHVYCNPEREEDFVRVNVNDGIVAIPSCDHGPGHSCPLRDFLQRIEQRGREVGEFGEVCALAPNASHRITFLHQ